MRTHPPSRMVMQSIFIQAPLAIALRKQLAESCMILSKFSLCCTDVQASMGQATQTLLLPHQH